MNVHPFRDLWLKGLALVFAVMLWLSVSGEPIVERGLEVPLEFENVPIGLEVVGTPPGAVSVRVRGAASVVRRLDPGSVVARLDLADALPGQRFFDMFADRIEVPTGIEVSSVVPASVTLVLERVGDIRSVPIEPTVEGQPSAGMAVGRVTIVPEEVDVVGPETRLSELLEAITETVSVAGATRDVVADVHVGVDDPTLRLVDPLVAKVTVEIVPATAEWTIEDVLVTAEEGPELPRVRFEPSRIAVTVRGDRDTMRALEPGSIRAVVDVGALAGLPPGRYNLPVVVESIPDVTVVRVDPPSVAVDPR